MYNEREREREGQREGIKRRRERKELFSTHALSAPPPFAWPSSFVTMTEATSTLSLKALA